MPVLHVRSDVTDRQLKCYLLPPAKCLASAGCAGVYRNGDRSFLLFSRDSTALSASCLTRCEVRGFKNLAQLINSPVIGKRYFSQHQRAPVAPNNKRYQAPLEKPSSKPFLTSWQLFVRPHRSGIMVNTITSFHPRTCIKLTNRLTDRYEWFPPPRAPRYSQSADTKCRGTRNGRCMHISQGAMTCSGNKRAITRRNKKVFRVYRA